jgi:ATP-binding cassette subfamily B protein IrtA
VADNADVRPVDIRRRARTMLVLEVVGAVAAVGSVVAIVQVCRTLLDGQPTAARLWWLVATAGVAVLIGLGTQVVSRLLGRTVTDTTRNLLHAGVTARLRGGRSARSLHADWRVHGSTLGRDVVNAGVATGRTGSELLSTGLVGLLSIGYLFWSDWRLALASLLPILIGLVAFGVLTARFNSGFREEYEQRIAVFDAVRPVVDLDARINRTGNRGRVATSARASARRLGTVTEEFGGYFVARIGALLGGRAVAEIAFSPLVVLLFVLGAGVLMAKAGWLTAVDLVPFVIVAVGLAAPLLAATYLLEDLVEGKKGAARLAAFASGTPADPSVADYGGEALALPETGAITVVDDTPDQVLDRIAATVPPGDIATVDVEQAVVLGPVGEYISASDPAEARRVAELAGIHDTITAFPHGYDSVVGQDVSLSYREARRLALARALASGRRVVVLDQRAFRGDTDVLRAAVADLEGRAVVVTVSAAEPAVVAGRIVRVDAGQAVEPDPRSPEHGKAGR